MITFRSLDGDIDRPVKPASSLDAWYDEKRDVPINELEVSDLCRACRQEIFLEHVLPVALERLKTDNLAGSLYDGELAVSVSMVPLSFWCRNKKLTKEAYECTTDALPQIDDDESAKLKNFLEKIAFLRDQNDVTS